jgi:hypothetical protein
MKLTKSQLKEIIREEIQKLDESKNLFGMKQNVIMPDENGRGRYEYTTNGFTLDVLYNMDSKFPYALAVYDKHGFLNGYSMKPFKTKEDMEKDIKRILPQLKSGKVKQTPFKV